MVVVVLDQGDTVVNAIRWTVSNVVLLKVTINRERMEEADGRILNQKKKVQNLPNDSTRHVPGHVGTFDDPTDMSPRERPGPVKEPRGTTRKGLRCLDE